MKIGGLESAAGNNPSLRRVLQDIEKWMTLTEEHLGFDPLASQRAKAKRATPPLLASMVVTGEDGHYLVEITNPVGSGPLLHEIRAATTVPISRATDVIVRGPGPDLSINIVDPGTTRYFQLRSRYATTDFNQPQITPAVSSGSVGSGSISSKNTTANPSGLTPILVQSDTGAIIIVNASTFTFGTDLEVSYNSALLTQDDEGNPLTFDQYYVYADDPDHVGGVVAYKATTDFSVLTANDGRVYFGTIVLRATGGGIGVGAGNGPCPATGSIITYADGSLKAIELAVAGDQWLGADGAETLISIDPLINLPCFTFTTKGGKVATVSSDHIYQLGSGGFVRALNLMINDRVNTSSGEDFVTGRVFAGMKTVFRIRLSRNKLYLSDGIWSHNKDEFFPIAL